MGLRALHRKEVAPPQFLSAEGEGSLRSIKESNGKRRQISGRAHDQRVPHSFELLGIGRDEFVLVRFRVDRASGGERKDLRERLLRVHEIFFAGINVHFSRDRWYLKSYGAFFALACHALGCRIMTTYSVSGRKQASMGCCGGVWASSRTFQVDMLLASASSALAHEPHHVSAMWRPCVPTWRTAGH